MPLTDPIAAGLDRRFEACCQSRAARRAAARWQTHDALRGLSLREIRRRLATGHPDHNPVLAAMLRAHQSGDGDATTVLLAAFIPYVHHDFNVRLNAERIADRWAALGHLLAVADPADAEHPDETRSYLYVLIGRMRRDAARLRLGQPDTVSYNDFTETTGARHRREPSTGPTRAGLHRHGTARRNDQARPLASARHRPHPRHPRPRPTRSDRVHDPPPRRPHRPRHLTHHQPITSARRPTTMCTTTTGDQP